MSYLSVQRPELGQDNLICLMPYVTSHLGFMAMMSSSNRIIYRSKQLWTQSVGSKPPLDCNRYKDRYILDNRNTDGMNRKSVM